ncbi:Six-hairpin glycosidase [Ramaria rubella]|nr:Six-hairpin glycosidase [Ramaria rubella]
MTPFANDLTPLVSVLFGLSFFSPCVFAQNFTDAQIQLVVARLADGAKQSWEIGTRAQALLELNSPLYSVFSNTTLPPPTTVPASSSLPANLSVITSIAQNTVSQLKNTTTSQPLVAGDGAAGDPASIGVAVLLANWTNAIEPIANSTNTNATHTNGTHTNETTTTVAAPSYAEAATDQLEFLLTSVPRTSDGAISHRVSQVQLWSDFVYMAPPFLAYYGVLNQNQSLIAESYNQIKLYRNYLRDAKADNLWQHIVMGSGEDPGHWSTGNGWAASGILRVLATIKHSNFADQFQSEQTDLKNWAVEILNGMYSHSTKTHIFNNYADNSSTFSDSSSTALIAAATYRLALLTQTYHNLPNAEASRKSLSDGSHLDSNGWLTPVVNPEDWSMSGSESPEGQAFVVEMQAAWQDWVAAGSPGANSARKVATTLFSVVAVGIAIALLAS